MSVDIAPNQDQVYQALLAFLEGILPAGIPCFRALPNRDPLPPTDPGYVVYQILGQERLTMPVDTYVTTGNAPPTTSTVAQDLELMVQIDAYGPYSGTWASLISTLFEDEYGFTAMGPNCEPLYCNDARMMPLQNSEDEYEERWCLTAALMYTPVATISQQYAETLDITLKDVNVLIPH